MAMEKPRLQIRSNQMPQTDFRLPGEPEEGRSKQLQSWYDAGQDVKSAFDTLASLAATSQASYPGYSAYGTMTDGSPSYLPPSVGAPGVAAAADQTPTTSVADRLAQMEAFQQQGRAAQDAVYANRAAQEAASSGRTLEDILALAGQYAPQVDYSGYRQALADQAAQLNAQIQAMYSQLGEQAAANVGRIQDIYGGATSGIEAGYGSAAQNIADAYTSAQQQAADQMARLGIEEAAGQVLPTQALSQAEALAQIEAGRAGGLAAAERYGASGAQFGSEMAQVGQQQGTEQQAAILRALQRQGAESLLMEAQDRARFDPLSTAAQILQLEQMINPPAEPVDYEAQAKFQFDVEQADQAAFSDAYNYYIDSVFVGGSDQERRQNAYDAAMLDALRGQLGPRLQAEAVRLGYGDTAQ